jgi:hypothetical protein
MVEITYQMVLSTIQTIGILVGIIYYIFSIRSSQRNQQMQLETRQAQLYMALLDRWNTKEFAKQRYDSYRMEWTDLDDFREKYNRRNNSDIFASWNTFGRSILGLAELKRKGLIDISFLDGMMLTDILNWWAHFGSLEKEAWERGSPNWWSHFPFIMEVIEYDRKNRPEGYDENGVYRWPRGKPWVQPEEMMQLRQKLLK